MASDPSGNRPSWEHNGAYTDAGTGDPIVVTISGLQYLLDTKQYDKIDQHNYSNLPLFNGNVSGYGCGFIAAIIAASEHGINVDVMEAYKYFIQPENELSLPFKGKVGAISPAAVYMYLIDQGLNFDSQDCSFLPNQSGILIYAFDDGSNTGWHYEYYQVNSSGITGYNGWTNQTYSTVEDYYKASHVTFIWGGWKIY